MTSAQHKERDAHIPYPGKQRDNESMQVLSEQALYLPIHLHLERKCLICCLAMALFQSFKISAKKKRGGPIAK